MARICGTTERTKILQKGDLNPDIVSEYSKIQLLSKWLKSTTWNTRALHLKTQHSKKRRAHKQLTLRSQVDCRPVLPVWSACGPSPGRTGCPWLPCQGSGRGPLWAAPGTPQTSSWWSCSGSPSSSPAGGTEAWWEESTLKWVVDRKRSTFRGATYGITPLRHQGVKLLLVEPAGKKTAVNPPNDPKAPPSVRQS